MYVCISALYSLNLPSCMYVFQLTVTCVCISALYSLNLPSCMYVCFFYVPVLYTVSVYRHVCIYLYVSHLSYACISALFSQFTVMYACISALYSQITVMYVCISALYSPSCMYESGLYIVSICRHVSMYQCSM